MLAIVPGAVAGRADDPTLPWVGGPAVVTPFEQYAGQLASAVVGRPVQVSCNGANDWSVLAGQQRFDAVTVWGFVVFDYDPSTGTYRPQDSMQLSEAASWYLDQYWQAPASDKGKTCRVGTHVTFTSRTTTLKVTKRVKVRGKWRTTVVSLRQTTQVPVEVPTFGLCPDYRNRVFALQTLSHESQHLAGIQDEATAERFGATADQALQMAGDYYRDFYLVERPGTTYYLPTCPDPVAG
jgi:hypothetical protein